jgi:hypothetical protein
MPELYQWLKGDPKPDSFIVNTVRSHTESEEAAKGMGLRLLMHYMGDIHQPLHLVSRYTAEHPKGDKGGNDFDLKYHYDADELHAVWDNVMYEYHKSVKRPFTSESFEAFGSIATDLNSKVGVSLAETSNLNFERIAETSRQYGLQAYDGIEPGKDVELPDWYIQKWKPILMKQVVLAGHRLAKMIENIYGQPSLNLQNLMI